MHVNGFGTTVKSCHYELRYLHSYQSAKIFSGVSERRKKTGEVKSQGRKAKKIERKAASRHRAHISVDSGE